MSVLSHQQDPHQRARLRWRARRGLLENDILLTRFLDTHENHLSDEEVTALNAVLDLTDNDLMDLFLARKPLEALLPEAEREGVSTDTLHGLVQKLRAA